MFLPSARPSTANSRGGNLKLHCTAPSSGNVYSQSQSNVGNHGEQVQYSIIRDSKWDRQGICVSHMGESTCTITVCFYTSFLYSCVLFYNPIILYYMFNLFHNYISYVCIQHWYLALIFQLLRLYAAIQKLKTLNILRHVLIANFQHVFFLYSIIFWIILCHEVYSIPLYYLMCDYTINHWQKRYSMLLDVYDFIFPCIVYSLLVVSEYIFRFMVFYFSFTLSNLLCIFIWFVFLCCVTPNPGRSLFVCFPFTEPGLCTKNRFSFSARTERTSSGPWGDIPWMSNSADINNLSPKWFSPLLNKVHLPSKATWLFFQV